MQVHARFSKRRLHINPPSTSSRINCRRSSQPLTHLVPKSIKTSSTATTMVGQGPWLRLKRTAIMNQAANIFTMQAATAKHGAGVARARPWLRVMAPHARRSSRTRAVRIVLPSAMRGSTSRERNVMARAPLKRVLAKLVSLNARRGST